jgi:hypothetical protein
LQALAGCEAQYTQQGQLLGPPRDAERQYRKNQKRPCEQGHQGQHGQVDAVRARQVADAQRTVARQGGHYIGGQGQRTQHGFAVGARGQAQIDARELAASAKQVLRCTEVHHGQRTAAGVHSAAYDGSLQLQAHLNLRRLGWTGRGAAPYLLCRGIQKYGTRRKHCKPPGIGKGQRHERRGDPGQQQGIHARHAQGVALTLRTDHQRLHLQHRAGQSHAGVGGYAGVEDFIEAPVCGTQFDVGLAVDRTHCAGKLTQRRGIDQVHRKRQRHAQHDGQYRSSIAPRVMAQLLP